MTPVEAVAQAIRREVRLSAGIAEGQEFRCDWDHVAAAVLAALELREQWAVVTEDGFPSEEPDDADDREHAEELAAERCQSCDHCRNALPKHTVRRLVSSWTSGSEG